MMIIKQKCGIINKWKADINNLIEFEREVSQGDIMEEISLWRDYEITLITKLRKEKSLIVYPKSFEHDNLKKSLKELKKIECRS
jgi:hypothetical protein